MLSSAQGPLDALISGQIDWEYLLSLASAHGLEPLLLLHLSRHSPAQFPESFLQSLQNRCNEIARRNLVLAWKLTSVSAHLTARAIEHLAYKGPFLAQTYYGNCGLRVFGDLDLVVPQPKIVAAYEALQEIGFSDKTGFSPAQRSAAFRFGFEHPLTDAAGIEIDLHWRVVPDFISHSLDSEGIWQRASRLPFFGHEVPSFCPEDLLVALCLHAGQHEWAEISAFCDIFQVMSLHPNLDWRIVSSHLGDSNTRRIVFVCLHLLQRHWNVTLPAEFASMVAADEHVASLADRVHNSFWPVPDSTPARADFRWLRDRSAGEKVVDRWRLCKGMTLNPTQADFEAFRLPGFLVPVYPWLRALRLILKYAQPAAQPGPRIRS